MNISTMGADDSAVHPRADHEICNLFFDEMDYCLIAPRGSISIKKPNMILDVHLLNCAASYATVKALLNMFASMVNARRLLVYLTLGEQCKLHVPLIIYGMYQTTCKRRAR
jgi:hypothetical protein